MNKMMCTLAEEVMDVVVNMEESSKRVKRRRVPKRVPKTESGSGVGEFMAGCYWIGHGKHQSLFRGMWGGGRLWALWVGAVRGGWSRLWEWLWVDGRGCVVG